MAISDVWDARPWLKKYHPDTAHDIPEITHSVPTILDTAARKFGPRPALTFFGKTISYTDFEDQVYRVAGGLQALGVQAGDRVAILLPNSPQAMIAFQAILRLGAIAVQHNPLYTTRELEEQFRDHRAKIAIVWSKAVSKIQGMAKDVQPNRIIDVDLIEAMPTVMQVVLKLPIPPVRAKRTQLWARTYGTTPWKELVGSSRLNGSHPYPGLDDIAVIQYTSGTTGVPKGAMISHRNMYANCLQSAQWMVTARDGVEVSFAAMPLFHAFGTVLFHTFGVLRGMNIVLFPNFDPSMIVKTQATSPGTMFCGAPPMYQKVASEAVAKKVSLKSINITIVGSMALPDSTVELWEPLTSGPLAEGYGLTECSPVVCCNPLTADRIVGTVGLPFPSTNIRVADPTDPADPAKDRGPGEDGELLVSGPQVFQGYWQKPDATAEIFVDRPDGRWLRTGDLVNVNTDGFIKIVDRLKEIIVTGGFNVAPTEVEGILKTHPDIEDVAVVGLPHANGSEEVVAAVILRDGAEVSAESMTGLRAWAKGYLTPYKVPRRFIAVRELQKNMLGKPMRRAIRQELIDSGHAGV